MKNVSYALITGASSGIGFELSCRAAENGYIPILVASKFDGLSKAAASLQRSYGIQSVILTCDLASENDIDGLIGALAEYQDKIGLVINNAGVGFGGSFHSNDVNQEQKLLAINVIAMVRLSHFFINQFLQKNEGYLLNVASLAGFQPGPYFANYYASKAYILWFTEALAVEVRNTGVGISVLCPGTTATNFHAKAKIQNTELAKGLFGIVMSAKQVSDIAFRGLKKGDVIIIPGYVNKIAAWSVRFVPRSLVRFITSWINAQPKASLKIPVQE